MGLSRPFVCALAVSAGLPFGCRSQPEQVRIVYRPEYLPPPEAKVVAWSQAPLASAQVPAGYLAGLIVDAESGLPLFKAQVHIASTTVGAMSDSTGRFRVRLPSGVGAIRVRRIGYSTSATPIVAHTDSGYVMVAALRREPTILCTVTTGYSGPRSAVVVSARDALTGLPLAAPVTVTVTDTAFRDSFVTTVDSSGRIPRTIAPERPGTYEVTLRSESYRDWQRSASTSTVTGCAGELSPAVFQAWLVPR